MVSSAVFLRKASPCTLLNPLRGSLTRSSLCRGLRWSVRTPRYRGTSLCKERQWRFQVRPEPVGTLPHGLLLPQYAGCAVNHLDSIFYSRAVLGPADARFKRFVTRDWLPVLLSRVNRPGWRFRMGCPILKFVGCPRSHAFGDRDRTNPHLDSLILRSQQRPKDLRLLSAFFPPHEKWVPHPSSAWVG